jgi:hypothetical protein
LQAIGANLIVLSNKPEHNLYSQPFNGRTLIRKFNSDEFNKNFTEQRENFINTFYSDDKKECETFLAAKKFNV